MLLAVCALAFFATSAVFRERLRLPSEVPTSAKIQYLALHGDEYDTLFLGSSRVYQHIIPTVFDRAMAEAGAPTHSYNLGMSAMFTPEDTFVLEQALAKRKRPLKYVIVESSGIIQTDYSFFGTDQTLRVAYWHDFKRLATVMRAIFFQNHDRAAFPTDLKKLPEQFKQFGYHFHLFISNYCNLGRGMEWCKRERQLLRTAGNRSENKTHAVATRGRASGSLRQLSEGNEGYAYVDPPIDLDAVQWAAIEAFVKRQPSRKFGDLESQRDLQAKRRLVAAHGGRMLALIPPSAQEPVFVPDPKFGAPIAVLDFCDSKRYPELFLRENRQDAGHLSTRGAELFSRLLAARLREVTREGPCLSQAGLPK